jgi:integrase
MRCFVRKIGTSYHAAFDWADVSYTHSLHTKNEREAEVRIGPIRDTLYRLEQGTLQLPPGADSKACKTFILSGGQLTSKPRHDPGPTVGRLAEIYLESRKVESTTRKTLIFRFNHLKRILKADKSLASIRLADIQGYANIRSREKYHGKRIQSLTIRKELQTFPQACIWAAEMDYMKTVPTWRFKSLELDKDRVREPFRTYEQIIQRIHRGGVSEAEQDRLWETLYLTSEELSELLAYVQVNATNPFVYPMVAFVAFSGCRRSEMVRSLLDDWDLENGRVTIREKKRDKTLTFTTREIDVHPRLAKVMSAWFADHPGGQHTISKDSGPVTVDQATDHFKRTVAGHEKWSKVRGFHTLRHSVASILASKGVDQCYIDRVLGHQTEAMRKRYQHLFPKGVKQAIEQLL